MVTLNGPVPAPLVICCPEIEGSEDVLQHTPRDVTAAPPSEVTLPPHTAEFEGIEDGVVVVTLGTVVNVTKETVLPYGTPKLLVAYALT